MPPVSLRRCWRKRCFRVENTYKPATPSSLRVVPHAAVKHRSSHPSAHWRAFIRHAPHGGRRQAAGAGGRSQAAGAGGNGAAGRCHWASRRWGAPGGKGRASERGRARERGRASRLAPGAEGPPPAGAVARRAQRPAGSAAAVRVKRLAKRRQTFGEWHHFPGEFLTPAVSAPRSPPAAAGAGGQEPAAPGGQVTLMHRGKAEGKKGRPAG